MSYLPITSGAYDGRAVLVESLAHVETWIDFTACNAQYLASTSTHDEYNLLWLDRKSCSDIIRILIIDAAITKDSARKRHMIETSFLLAHHPQVDFTEFMNDGMSCCKRQSVGLASLVKSVAVPFIYLNLFWSCVVGNSSSPLLQPHEHLQHYPHSYYLNSAFTTLLPRPAYMNTQSLTI
ncbi:hypothetical protein P171DRAFT_160093 [Karstenula rhodostoma CBS 690.94]|uniref:Uncharacterized protein n=1 Tax=Karstenula rhodostoma CBS 690.94 TaxID=1392251 RepID=A0A9P4P6P6_9PLEO|nr:hypothetical protein P171DRAFT_160093 [Karstenula rhodostoma CBS 690.94]